MNNMNIPICPKCKKPTRRQEGYTYRPAVHQPVVYDENGEREPTPEVKSTTEWTCLDCGETFTN